MYIDYIFIHLDCSRMLWRSWLRTWFAPGDMWRNSSWWEPISKQSVLKSKPSSQTTAWHRPWKESPKPWPRWTDRLETSSKQIHHFSFLKSGGIFSFPYLDRPYLEVTWLEKRTGSLMMEYQAVKRAQILYYVNYVKQTFEISSNAYWMVFIKLV